MIQDYLAMVSDDGLGERTLLNILMSQVCGKVFLAGQSHRNLQISRCRDENLQEKTWTDKVRHSNTTEDKQETSKNT